MFRNLRFYRLHSEWPETEQALSDCLSEHSFSPCSAFSERSAGWESPGHSEGELLCRKLHGADLLQLRTQSRVLPTAAINEALESRLVEYRQRSAQEPTKAEVRRLKEQTRDELLPKTLVKSERHLGCFIKSESMLVINVATAAKAEWFIDHLRLCFPRFRCVPLTFNTSVSELMNRVFMGESPLRFALGRECKMQDLMDSRATATWREIDLAEPAIRHHVAEGMKLMQLGLCFDEILSCVINEDAVISKFKFFEGEEADVTDHEDPLTRQDTHFVLMVGTVLRLLEDLKKLLGGYAVNELK
jgi:recombination associated protein RdgC